MSNSNFDKNGVDSSGTHWLQYAALVFAAFAVYTTWAYFFDNQFNYFIKRILNFIDCSGFHPISSYCINLLR